MRVWRFIYSIEFSKTVEDGMCNFCTKKRKRKMTQNENHILLLMRRNFLVQATAPESRFLSTFHPVYLSFGRAVPMRLAQFVSRHFSFIRHSIVMLLNTWYFSVNAKCSGPFYFYFSFIIFRDEVEMVYVHEFNVIHHQDDGDDDEDEDINPNSECFRIKSSSL